MLGKKKGRDSTPPRETGLDSTILPPLTEKQRKCLEFILRFFLRHRFYPTHREIAKAMSIRSTTAEMYLEPLEKKGYIERKAGAHRKIRITPEALERLKLDGLEGGEQPAAA